MSNIKYFTILGILILLFTITACAPAPEVNPQYDPGEIKFSGEQAFAIEEQFVTSFQNRTSGSAESAAAVIWLQEQFSSRGWNCEIDEWEAVFYGEATTLRNVVCKLPGESDQEILVLAHHDIAPTTVQGADNDGSGVAIMLHMAEIFAAENPLPYTLVFVADDAEEYGMLGSARYVEKHPNLEKIIAGISLDNLGRSYYQDMGVEQVGQYDGFAPIWLPLAAREAAQAADTDWEVVLKGPIDQVLNQAITISLTDQGPINAAGVPAIGFGPLYPAEYADIHYECWHDPCDNMLLQSAASLEQSGIITEALIRQLLAMDSFPEATGPYMYFDDSKQVLSGLPLYLIFIGFVSVFFVGSYFTQRESFSERYRDWLNAVPHFLGLWLPLVVSILLLYLLVAVGVMQEFTSYPGTTKDLSQLNPNWSAVILFLIGLAIFFMIGRWFVRRFAGDMAPEFGSIKSLGFLIIGIISLFILIIDPFALIFFIPVLFWLLIRGRSGAGRILDVIFFLLGGLMIYALIYFFGFLILRYEFVFLWYFMSAISTGMFSFIDVAAGAAVMAAGLSMIVNPPSKGNN
ncbi:MAG: M28 family peptidase [Chloroflexota bacterium]|nr:MAG: M28 family peptidase [Chloroflexota bacterium]